MRVIRFLIGAWLGFMVCLCGCAPDSQAAGSASRIVGAWRTKVQFKDGAFASVKDLEFLYAFNGGGTLTESSNYDGAPPVPPAYGVWRQTGEGRYRADYAFYTTAAPRKWDEVAKGGGWLPSGRGSLREEITLSADGNKYESTIVMQLYDKADKPVAGGGTATGVGERLRF